MTLNGYATGAGTKLFYGDSFGAETTQLAGVKKYPKLPGLEADEFDTTRVDQTDSGEIDFIKQKGLGYVDPGNLEIMLGFVDANTTAVYGLMRVTKFWKIVYSNGATLQFSGAIKAIGPEVQEKDEVTISVTVMVTSKHTFTAGTGGGTGAGALPVPVAVELTQTKTASYTGASYDLGAAFAPGGIGIAMAATIAATALDHTSGDETYTFTLQQSPDNATWTAAGGPVAVTAIGLNDVPGYVSMRYVRANLVEAGTTPSLTYSTSLKRL